jgi:hypothetical protein
MANPDYVTESDINMIDYFLIDRGDITRWCAWEKRRPVIEKTFPELIAALNTHEVAKKTLARVARSIVDEIYEYPEE